MDIAETTEALSSDAREDLPLVVYFVRHGHAAGPEIIPELGPPLSKLGEYQAERVAARLAKEKFDHIYSSDLTRAHETARIIIRYHRDTPFTVTPDLREITHHNFVRETTLLATRLRKMIKKDRQIVERFAERIRLRHHPQQKILIVSHGNMIRTLMPVLGGKEPRQSILLEINNASVSLLDVWPTGEAVLRLANCTKHLLPRQIT